MKKSCLHPKSTAYLILSTPRLPPKINSASTGIIYFFLSLKTLKKDGIKAKRFRSGDLKQAGHPYFKMTDKEDRYMQEQVMLYAEKFYNIVSEGRGIPRPLLESLDITSGRTFIGGQAQSVGLIDGITNFDAAFVKIAGLAQKNIDSRNTNPVTYGKF